MPCFGMYHALLNVHLTPITRLWTTSSSHANKQLSISHVQPGLFSSLCITLQHIAFHSAGYKIYDLREEGENENRGNPTTAMEVPMLFRCPISMELMQDPVTVSTGVSYDRKNIEKWLHCYGKRTCPATMQLLQSFDLTPNHTLKRLILAWQEGVASLEPSPPVKCEEMVGLLKTVASTPFKVSSLKKLRSMIEAGDEMKAQFVTCGGVKALGVILSQSLADSCDFQMFRACEEALSVLRRLSLYDDDLIQLLSEPDCFKAMAAMLQRGSAEARLDAVTILQLMLKMQCNSGRIASDFDMEIVQSLLELISDEICSRASSYALDVLIEIVAVSMKSRWKAIEAGAVKVLIELLPDSSRSKCEKMLFLLKLLCECAEGRLAFSGHPMAVAVISEKIFHVSELSSKLVVRILWLICSSHPTDQILEEMLVFGAVKMLVGLLHIQGASSTKEKVMKILKMHGKSWAQYPCFPLDVDDYLRLFQAQGN